MDEREEIVSYLEQVRAEVVRRREIVRQIEIEISAIEQSLKKQSTGASLDVQVLKASEGRRAQVQKEISGKRVALENALLDLKSAQEREVDVLEELSEFDARK